MTSARAAQLVQQLEQAVAALIALVEHIPPDRWVDVARSGEWSPGKDAAHVVEGNALHQWVVRSSLHLAAGQRPAIERSTLTTELSPAEVVARLRQRTQESAALIASLTDEQLTYPCRTRTVDAFVVQTMIGHLGTHQAEIARKLGHVP